MYYDNGILWSSSKKVLFMDKPRKPNELLLRTKNQVELKGNSEIPKSGLVGEKKKEKLYKW